MEKISSLEKKVAELKKNSVKNLPGEIWRDVVGYEGLYQVSNKGRIKSFQWKKVTILQPFKNKKNYFFVDLRKNKIAKKIGVNVLVARAFLPNPKNLPVVHHKDNNPANNCVENLQWVTHGENIQYAIENGLWNNSIRGRKGEKNVQAKLTEEQVKFIRKNYKPREKNFGAIPLAKKFNVSHLTIRAIVNNVTWKHLLAAQSDSV